MPARLTSLVAITLLTTYVGAETGLIVRDARIREAPPGATALAGYMVIENQSAETRKLIAAESAAFDAIEMHRSMVENGIARMVPQASISIPAGGRATLDPNGYHLMMMRPAKSLRAGDDVNVLLTFDGGKRLSVTFPVTEGAGGADLHHHH